MVPPRTDIRWVFDPLPASGARRGGEATQHAFSHDLNTFVREVVQNANDQARDVAEVRFGYQLLEGPALAGFLDAIRWPSLEPHIDPATRTGMRDGELDALELALHGPLPILTISDHGTVGLTGGESEDTGHFTALCRDVLFSHKTDDSAGGSFGLGKSVLWLYSGLSTVLFNSVLSTHLEGQTSPRLIGRCELASHATTAGDWFAGAGWFGQVGSTPQGYRAESVWGRDATQLAADLGLTRAADDAGTSIAIVGFRDPTSDKPASNDALEAQLGRAVVHNFWPGMLAGGLRVGFVRQTHVAPFEVAGDPDIAPFVAALAKPPGEALEMSGDVVCRELPVSIPGTRDGDVPVDGFVRLFVRLAEPGDGQVWQDHVAIFRGPGMIIRYWPRRRLAVGARPFHAVLCCGIAREPSAPTDADRAIEAFLRAAEPPAHTSWTVTRRLRAHYKRGYKKAIDSLERAVSDAIRQLVTAQPPEGRRGPDRLRRRFPLGASSRIGSGRGISPFRFADLGAHFDGERWTLFGKVEPTTTQHNGWIARLRLNLVQEDGRRGADIPLRLIEADEVRCHIKDGAGLLIAPWNIHHAEFIAESITANEADRWRGEVEVALTGELG